jgi:putative ABC transport system permease protein
MIPLNYNLRNLYVRSTTTLATAIGIAFVVAVLAAAMMLVEGLRQTLDRSGKADTAIVIRKGSDSEMPSSIEDATINLIKGAPGIAKAADGQSQVIGECVVVLFYELANGKGKSNALVRGVTADVLAFRPEVKIEEGKMATPGSDEVIVGEKLVGRFKGMEIGNTIELRKGRLGKIVGTFSADGSSYESEIWGDLDFVRGSFGRDGVVQSVRVKLTSAAAFDGFEAFVEQDKRLGLEAMGEVDYYRKQSEGTALFLTVLGSLIAVFCSVGAMIGASITMYGAVANRKREIGVLRALGFSRLTIMISFLFESIMLALLGGMLGVLAALALQLVEFKMMNFATFSEIVFRFQATPEILMNSVIAGGVMGVIGGFLPAVRAARTPPIEAMRG